MSIQQAPLANSQTILPTLADVEKFNCATCMQKYKEARAMFHTVIKHQPLEEKLGNTFLNNSKYQCLLDFSCALKFLLGFLTV